MIAIALGLEPLAPREQGWIWWAVLVLCLAVGSLLVAVVRRRLLAPMKHGPSDTTDSWREAGRRLQVPEGEEGGKDGADEESP
jgi:hypothetical protein